LRMSVANEEFKNTRNLRTV